MRLWLLSKGEEQKGVARHGLDSPGQNSKIHYFKAISAEPLKEGAKIMELDPTFFFGIYVQISHVFAALQSVSRGNFTLMR
jgi:hypothetical protein